jgi:hypothetical protein
MEGEAHNQFDVRRAVSVEKVNADRQNVGFTGGGSVHHDPRITTEIYGHLEPGYLRATQESNLRPTAPEAVALSS